MARFRGGYIAITQNLPERLGKNENFSNLPNFHHSGKSQLAEKYQVSTKTIARDLTGMRYVQKISKFKQVIIQMDTTYWGRNFGLMVIKDALRKKILWRKYVSDHAQKYVFRRICSEV